MDYFEEVIQAIENMTDKDFDKLVEPEVLKYDNRLYELLTDHYDLWMDKVTEVRKYINQVCADKYKEVNLSTIAQIEFNIDNSFNKLKEEVDNIPEERIKEILNAIKNLFELCDRHQDYDDKIDEIYEILLDLPQDLELILK